MFPKVPQSSLGILRVPQLPPPLEHPPLKNPVTYYGNFEVTPPCHQRNKAFINGVFLGLMALGGRGVPINSGIKVHRWPNKKIPGLQEYGPVSMNRQFLLTPPEFFPLEDDIPFGKHFQGYTLVFGSVDFHSSSDSSMKNIMIN